MPSTNRRHRSLSSHRYQLRRSQRQTIQQDQSSVNRTTVRNEPQQQRVTRCLRSELEAEDALFEEIEELINLFLTRPNRRRSYKTVIRWSVNPGTAPNYTVMIKIDQPSSS